MPFTPAWGRPRPAPCRLLCGWGLGTPWRPQFNQTTIIEEAKSCSENGKVRKTCQTCGEWVYEVITIPHQYNEPDGGILSSLTVREQHCTECDAVRYVSSDDVWDVTNVLIVVLCIALIVYIVFAAIPFKKRLDNRFRIE